MIPHHAHQFSATQPSSCRFSPAIMRFFAPITVLNLGATALPFLNKRDEPVNVLAPVQEEFTPTTYAEGTELFVIEATGAVEKRVNYMHVDVWRDTNKKGRHEGFYSERKSRHGGRVQHYNGC
jgi:hypothetical protein